MPENIVLGWAGEEVVELRRFVLGLGGEEGARGLAGGDVMSSPRPLERGFRRKGRMGWRWCIVVCEMRNRRGMG